MAKYKLMGKEHLEGVSKKTGNAYNMDVLHVVALDERGSKNLTGQRVDKITVSPEDSSLLMIGETVEICFNRFGRVEYVEPVR